MKTEQVSILVDRSSSINDYGIRDAVREAVNRVIDTVALDAHNRRRTVEVYVNVVLFANKTTHLRTRTPADEVRELTAAEYQPYGGTAMLDAVGEVLDVTRAGEPHLIYVITDGEENASRFPAPIIQRIKSPGDNVTLVVQGPPRCRARMESYGFAPGNIDTWEQTEQGTQCAEVKTSGGILRNYSKAMAQGKTQIADFYSDASNITDKDLKKLKDLSSKVKLKEVPAESRIDEFTAKVTKRPYVIGQTYYQLMKKEVVQPSKAVLIRNKLTGHVYGGEEARKLVGITTAAYARVSPGNHADYDIFVESRSVNRKLPRGTKVLIDTQRTVNATPTWDHTAAAV